MILLNGQMPLGKRFGVHEPTRASVCIGDLPSMYECGDERYVSFGRILNTHHLSLVISYLFRPSPGHAILFIKNPSYTITLSMGYKGVERPEGNDVEIEKCFQPG